MNTKASGFRGHNSYKNILLIDLSIIQRIDKIQNNLIMY